jgi:hypothetical protein
LVVFHSLSTCDAGDIKKDNIQCSIIGVNAEVYVCKAIASQTHGTYRVALNEDHFKEILFLLLPPPPSTTKTETALIKMGFPQKRTENTPSLCIWYLHLIAFTITHNKTAIKCLNMQDTYVLSVEANFVIYRPIV